MVKITNNFISFVVHKSAIAYRHEALPCVHIFTVRNYGTLKLYRNTKFIILLVVTYVTVSRDFKGMVPAMDRIP